MSFPPTHHYSSPSLQGKFIRIHFGATGKLASADIETCECHEFARAHPELTFILTSFNISLCSVSSLSRSLALSLSPSLFVSVPLCLCVSMSVYSSVSKISSCLSLSLSLQVCV